MWYASYCKSWFHIRTIKFDLNSVVIVSNLVIQVMGDRGGNIRWWDVTSGHSSSFSTRREGILRIKFSPFIKGDSSRGRVAVLFYDNTFSIYDLVRKHHFHQRYILTLWECVLNKHKGYLNKIFLRWWLPQMKFININNLMGLEHPVLYSLSKKAQDGIFIPCHVPSGTLSCPHRDWDGMGKSENFFDIFYWKYLLVKKFITLRICSKQIN